MNTTYMPNEYNFFPKEIDGLARNFKFVLDSTEVKIAFNVSKSFLERTWKPPFFTTKDAKKKKVFFLPQLIKSILEREKGKNKTGNEQEFKNLANTNIDEEKLKLVIAQTNESIARERKVTLENDLKERKSFDAEEVRIEVEKIFLEVKTKLRTIPSACTQEILALETYAEINDLLSKKIDETLVALVYGLQNEN